MSAAVDIGILELLASKICHDLISPIGAVNNGIEFLEDMGADAGEEVTDLISFSAGQASARLKAYRMAYGAGGADDSIKPEEVYKAIQDIVGAEDKVKQDWDAYGDLGYGDERPKAFCKMLICGLLLAMDSMPKGGMLRAGAGDEAGQTRITAIGDGASIREKSDIALSLDLPREALEPKYVHAYMTGLLGQTYGYGFSILNAGDGQVDIIITHPPA
ncbi:MAG: histidine phosphotransferase family protein [Alphaproteobacteria bacterium]